jgi:hypothetical protein
MMQYFVRNLIDSSPSFNQGALRRLPKASAAPEFIDTEQVYRLRTARKRLKRRHIDGADGDDASG